MFFKLEPEVAGGWGTNTKFTKTPGRPTIVQSLHYRFDGWLGDDILESCLCFIVTLRLSQELRRQELSGFSLRDVEVSTSEEFVFFHPNLTLPEFRWLFVEGKAGDDDFGSDIDGRLVVSARVLETLKMMKLDHCEISEFNNS